MVCMHHHLAQSFGHRWLLSLLFGSSHTDDWLLRYGHFKVWGVWVVQKEVGVWVTCRDQSFEQAWYRLKLMVYMEKGSM